MNSFSQAIESLPEEARFIATSLHETALALGYTAKISPVGSKPDDWKCEYLAVKPKRVLYILRVTGRQFSIRTKLYHIGEYADVLECCTEHCKSSLLSASKNCGSHGGGCAGPVVFAFDGKTYSKCRHSILFEDIRPEDADGLRLLLQNEAERSANR